MGASTDTIGDDTQKLADIYMETGWLLSCPCFQSANQQPNWKLYNLIMLLHWQVHKMEVQSLTPSLVDSY